MDVRKIDWELVDEPMNIAVVDGEIVMEGAPNIIASMSPSAARITGEKLLEAAAAAMRETEGRRRHC